MIFALLPVKSTQRAKQRLLGLLSHDEREQLARTMFSEVLDQLLAVRRFDQVVVASSDRWVLDHAANAGALPFEEGRQNGHSASADWAAGECRRLGASSVLIAPMDVPLAKSQEFESLLEAAETLGRPGLVIVPSEDGAGTNALVRTPPDLILSRFGPGSLEAHIRQARQKNAAVKILRPPGITFDIDTVEDLVEFCGRATKGRTLEYLRRIGAAVR